MTIESVALRKFRKEWVGKTVLKDGFTGVVVGVCDDGSQCDFDRRRKFKPTGELIVRLKSGVTHYWHCSSVTIINYKQNSTQY